MNNIKSIIEEQEKEFDKRFDNTKTQLYEYSQRLETYTSCGNTVKQFFRQSQKTLVNAIIADLIGEKFTEVKIAEILKIAVSENKEGRFIDATRGYARGFNQHRAEAKAIGEEIIKEL